MPAALQTIVRASAKAGPGTISNRQDFETKHLAEFAALVNREAPWRRCDFNEALRQEHEIFL